MRSVRVSEFATGPACRVLVLELVRMARRRMCRRPNASLAQPSPAQRATKDLRIVDPNVQVDVARLGRLPRHTIVAHVRLRLDLHTPALFHACVHARRSCHKCVRSTDVQHATLQPFRLPSQSRYVRGTKCPNATCAFAIAWCMGAAHVRRKGMCSRRKSERRSKAQAKKGGREAVDWTRGILAGRWIGT